MKLLEKFRALRREKAKQETEARADALYQLCEYNGEIWLTYGDHLICPTEMLKDDAVTVVKTVRQLFVDRMINSVNPVRLLPR